MFSAFQKTPMLSFALVSLALLAGCNVSHETCTISISNDSDPMIRDSANVRGWLRAHGFRLKAATDPKEPTLVLTANYTEDALSGDAYAGWKVRVTANVSLVSVENGVEYGVFSTSKQKTIKTFEYSPGPEAQNAAAQLFSKAIGQFGRCLVTPRN